MALTGRATAAHIRFRSITLTFAIVVAGGVLGWTGWYIGLRRWGLLLGLVLTAIVLARLSRRRRRSVGLVAGFGFAFLLLTWPLLWVAVGYVRYLITGEPIEND
jgi:hypothetical protein